jgi:tetratricopeptide (TPR) repeat protein
MRRAVAMPTLFLVAVALLAGACFSASHHTPEATEENFGVNMARQNLWREAMFRFQRAVDLNPGDAMAHNNLAVAYEANGEFDKAAKEYREAMRLDKSNQYIQKNYSRYIEFTSRNKKRQQKRETTAPEAKTASTKTDTAPAPAPPAAAPAPEPPAAQPQPTGTAPANVPPAAPAPAAPPTPPPPPVKPPGELR